MAVRPAAVSAFQSQKFLFSRRAVRAAYINHPAGGRNGFGRLQTCSFLIGAAQRPLRAAYTPRRNFALAMWLS